MEGTVGSRTQTGQLPLIAPALNPKYGLSEHLALKPVLEPVRPNVVG
jgi:hypothetical protein